MRGHTPAVLGGTPAFAEPLALARPTLPPTGPLLRRIESILDSGVLTNGPTVRQLEQAVAEHLGVAFAVAVSNATAGLMLVYRALGVSGRVVLPSYTFSASAHAVVWVGGQCDFADVQRGSATLNPAVAAPLVAGAGALSATHLSGTPAATEQLDELGRRAGIPVVYDAAHAFGSRRAGTPIGRFGAAEVFSLSPTKPVVGLEGGLVTTDDGDLADRCRVGRDYGNPGDYDCRFVGLNARLSEIHAAVALASLSLVDDHVVRRNELAARFWQALAGVQGLRPPSLGPGDTTTHKDLSLFVDAEAFGLDADGLQEALRAEGIDTRRYYSPPVHRQQAYAPRWRERRPLPVTEQLASSSLSLPLWSSMEAGTVERVAKALVQLHEHAGAVRHLLDDRTGVARSEPAAHVP